MKLALFALLVAGVAIAGGKPKVKVKITPDGPCDKAQLDALRAALAKAERATWTALVSNGLADACEARLPQSIAVALDDMHSIPVEEHGAAMVQAFRDAPDFAKAGCPKWEEHAAGRTAPGDKLHAMFKDCAIGKLELATEDEYVGVPNLGAAYVAAPLYKWLTTSGMEAANAKKFVRGLLALEDPRKAEKKVEKKPAPKKK